MKLTESERELFAAMKGRRHITLDELEVKIPSASRKSIVVRVKYLAAKIASEGYIIERTSPIGRGHRAVYSMTRVQ